MFDGKRYASSGIAEKIPLYLQNLLWFMVEAMEVPKKDFLQVFELREASEDGNPMQGIVHSQEQPPYLKELTIIAKKPINAKIYILDVGIYSTMLLAEEY